MKSKRGMFLLLSLFFVFAASGFAETKTACCKDGRPPGFIRVGSTSGANSACPLTDPQILNLCVYARYDNLPSGAQLKVCVDEPTPNGWDESQPFQDPYGCDAQKYGGGGVRNAKNIRKR
jgi:hypothetical protein